MMIRSPSVSTSTRVPSRRPARSAISLGDAQANTVAPACDWHLHRPLRSASGIYAGYPTSLSSCRRRAPAVIRYAGRHLGFLAGLLIAAVAIGVAYRYLFDPLDERTVPYYIRSCIHAMGLTFAGWAVHLIFAAVPRSRLGGVLRRLPLSAEFVIKALTMTAALTIVAGGLQFVLYPFPVSQRWLADELPRIVVIGFSASLVVGAIFEFRRMVGGRVLGSFLLGTYHRPRREQRIVMFLDIAGSTALAEQLGEVRVHDLITRFFFDIDEPIADQDGEVHAYVGDEVIVTWPLSEDPERNAQSLRCFFAIEERMTELAPSYAQEFGVVPRFRAGIHAGSVVVSEWASRSGRSRISGIR